MQSPAGQVHIGGLGRVIQGEQLARQPLSVVGLDALGLASREKGLKTLVFE
jgi:hypothetical protein